MASRVGERMEMMKSFSVRASGSRLHLKNRARRTLGNTSWTSRHNLAPILAAPSQQNGPNRRGKKPTAIALDPRSLMRICILEGDYEVHDRSRNTLVVATSGFRGTDSKQDSGWPRRFDIGLEMEPHGRRQALKAAPAQMQESLQQAGGRQTGDQSRGANCWVGSACSSGRPYLARSSARAVAISPRGKQVPPKRLGLMNASAT